MNKLSVLCALTLCAATSSALAQTREAVMPKPREVSGTEQEELAKLISLYTERDPPRELRFAAAGAYRFADSAQFRYFDRNDLGSVALELVRYGTGDRPLDFARLEPSELVLRGLRALERSGLDVRQLRFARLLDEYAGAAQPSLLPTDFDPRRASIQVARTLRFERAVDDLPVFGSEVLVGLMEDGTIGRLRYHAPVLDERVIERARKLRDAVANGTWKLPKLLYEPDTEVLEVQAGVGHSSFASPRYRSAAVVRVIYRRHGGEAEQRLQTTRYAYYDAAGREITLDVFPEAPGTAEGEKKR
jgi:hypothetical protein